MGFTVHNVAKPLCWNETNDANIKIHENEVLGKKKKKPCVVLK